LKDTVDELNKMKAKKNHSLILLFFLALLATNFVSAQSKVIRGKVIDENKEVLTKAIKHVANENIRQIGEWKKEHPNCTDSDSKKNTLYLNIVSNSMSGTTCEEQTKNYEKIISNIAKEVVIEK
jgi:hypothetical protein